MSRYLLFLCCAFLLASCDKHDPILPGVRTDVFNSGANLELLNQDVPDLPDSAPVRETVVCEYTIDSTNTIRDANNRKIFVGFASSNTVDIETRPVCSGGYVYAGLNTGNVVKIAPKNRNIVWMSDVYSESNMMGGASTVDIVAPLVIDGSYIYAGGMGDAFCKINITNGSHKWCIPIGTRFPFIVLANVAYIMGLDNTLYAVRTSDGAIYWQREIARPGNISYENRQIYINRKHFDASTGAEIK